MISLQEGLLPCHGQFTPKVEAFQGNLLSDKNSKATVVRLDIGI